MLLVRHQLLFVEDTFHFVEEGGDHVGLGHASDLNAFAVDEAHAPAAGQSHVGMLGFAGAVDDAAHHGNRQVQHAGLLLRQLSQALLDLLGDADDVNLAPAA